MINRNPVPNAKRNLAVVVPCFNEEKRFDLEYFDHLSRIEGTVWLFVDDGSNDATLSILRIFCGRSNTDFLHLPKNVGKSEALRIGMSHSIKNHPEVKWIGFLDSDGAFSIEDVNEILTKVMKNEFEKYEAIFTSRVKLSGRRIQRKPYRHLLGRILTTIFGVAWKDIPYDTQSGFKVMRNTQTFRDSILKPLTNRWFFDIEIVLRMARSQNKLPQIWEEPLFSWVDVSGSKISFREYLRLVFEISKIIILLFRNRKHLTDSNSSIMTNWKCTE